MSVAMLFLSCKSDEKTDENVDYSQPQGTFIDARDDKIYKWVRIGTQVWMAENLAYTGNNIQRITSNNEWSSNFNYDGWSYYNNDVNYGDQYGVLYQWEAAKTASPLGWHLPTDEEWTILENYLIEHNFSYDGIAGNNGIAKSLAMDSGWKTSDIQGAVGNSDFQEMRNKTGFSALPSGSRDNEGNFDTLLKCSDWWSDTEQNADLVYNRLLFFENAQVNTSQKQKSYGFAVRCIKD